MAILHRNAFAPLDGGVIYHAYRGGGVPRPHTMLFLVTPVVALLRSTLSYNGVKTAQTTLSIDH